MKFSSVLGFVAGLAGLSTAVAAPHGHHHGHGSSETVTIAAATILVEENTSNYYITFEAVELVEVVETSSGYKARSNELATRQPWGYGSSNYGSHVTISEEIVLVEVVSQKKYKTVTAIAVAEYISISSRDLEARHNYDHSHRHVIAIAVEEIIVISGRHYKVVEATSVQVYFQSGSSKREALPAPGHHGHGHGHGSSETITIAVEEEIFVNGNYYETAVAIEVVVEVVN